MIKAIIVLDKLLQSIILSVTHENYVIDTQLIYSLTHHNSSNVDSILTNDINNVLLRSINEFISIAIVHDDEEREDGQVFKAPLRITRLMRQLQEYFNAFDAVKVTKNILIIKQKLQTALDSQTGILTGFDDNRICFIDAVMTGSDKVYAIKDKLSGPFLCTTSPEEFPVTINYNKDMQELECIVNRDIKLVIITFHSVDNSYNIKKCEVRLVPPSLSHSYKHPKWIIHSSYGGKYSLCNFPGIMFSHADIVFEGGENKSGEIYRFYF